MKKVKSKSTRWAGHVACITEFSMHAKFWTENLKERDHLENLSKDARVILD